MRWMTRRRRELVSNNTDDAWTHIFLADNTGKVPKEKIPVYAGQRIYVEWDTSRISENSNAVCIFSFFNQNMYWNENSLNPDPVVTASYPILWNNNGANYVFAGGYITISIPHDATMYICCWDEGQYTGTDQSRRLIGDYIKVRIS